MPDLQKNEKIGFKKYCNHCGMHFAIQSANNPQYSLDWSMASLEEITGEMFILFVILNFREKQTLPKTQFYILNVKTKFLGMW